MRGDDLTFKADATIAEVDLQQIGHEFGVPALESERYEGRLGGRVVTEGTITGLSGGVTLDNVQATARMDLEPSTIGRPGHRPGDARRGLSRRARRDIRQLDIVGPRSEREGERHPGVERHRPVESRRSRRTRRVSRRSASSSNWPSTGIAKVDGTLTGNRAELRATGHARRATASSTARTARCR